MKNFALLFCVLLLCLVSGCDSVYGPGFVNDTDHPVKITARFKTGQLEFSLRPHESVVQISSGKTLQSLVVVKAGRRLEFAEEKLQLMLKGLSNDDVLLVVRENTVDVRSMNAAKRDHLLDGPGK